MDFCNEIEHNICKQNTGMGSVNKPCQKAIIGHLHINSLKMAIGQVSTETNKRKNHIDANFFKHYFPYRSAILFPSGSRL